MPVRGEGWLATAVCAALVVATAGCTVDVPATEVIVVVDATEAVKARALTLMIEISASDAREGPFGGNVQTVYGPPAAAIMFPRRVALVPRNDDARRVFQLRAIARDTSGVVATALVRSTYSEHRLVELRIVLDSTPCTPECTGEDTCREGRCVPIFVDPGMLPSADAGPDAAPPDASPDGSVELGPVDMGMPDHPACTSAAQCDDSNLCNGVETCDHGSCVPGMPISCDDGVLCTDDSCDPATGICAHTPVDALCDVDPGGFCDRIQGCQYPTCSLRTCAPNPLMCETAVCDSSGACRRAGCAVGTFCCAGRCEPVGCPESPPNPCTTDACGASGCEHVPAPFGSACSDGNDCTIGDMCVGTDCQTVTILGNGMACDNGDACFGDICVSGVCTSCDDGNVCAQHACVGGACMTTGSSPGGTPCVTAPECHVGFCNSGTCFESSAVDGCLFPQVCCGDRCLDMCS